MLEAKDIRKVAEEVKKDKGFGGKIPEEVHEWVGPILYVATEELGLKLVDFHELGKARDHREALRAFLGEGEA